MRQDISPLRAAVLLSRELSKAVDEASRRCLIRSIDHIFERWERPEGISTLGKRILQSIGSQKLTGRTIARLVGVAYSGRIRAELKSLVEAGKLQKVSGHYHCTVQCDKNSTPEKA